MDGKEIRESLVLGLLHMTGGQLRYVSVFSLVYAYFKDFFVFFLFLNVAAFVGNQRYA